MKIGLIIGNPKAGSRTTKVAQQLAHKTLLTLRRDDIEIKTFELAPYSARMFEWQDGELDALKASVKECDLIVTACPTYKASYTGLLKAFLDRFARNELNGIAGIPLMIGAAPDHALAVELHMRPLLVELGASMPTRGLFVLESQLDALDAVLDEFMVFAAPQIKQFLKSS